MAYGKLGLTPEQYGRTGLYDFNLMADAYQEHERSQWKHTRRICWLIYQANADPKKAAKSEDTWWPLGEKIILPTKAQINRENKKLQSRIDKALAKINS